MLFARRQRVEEDAKILMNIIMAHGIYMWAGGSIDNGINFSPLRQFEPQTQMTRNQSNKSPSSIFLGSNKTSFYANHCGGGGGLFTSLSKAISM